MDKLNILSAFNIIPKKQYLYVIHKWKQFLKLSVLSIFSGILKMFRTSLLLLTEDEVMNFNIMLHC